MKIIINIKLARALRANLNAINSCLENMNEELARVDARENPQHPNSPQDCLTDAQVLAGMIEQACEALAHADGMLSSQVGDSKIYSQPPAFARGLMRQMQRIRGRA